LAKSTTEDHRKAYTTFASPIAFFCLVGAVGVAFLSVLVITLTALIPGFDFPNSTYQFLDLPAISVLLPIGGMILLAPLAIGKAFSSPKAEAETSDSRMYAVLDALKLKGHIVKHV
jgi:hypothetical protein